MFGAVTSKSKAGDKFEPKAKPNAKNGTSTSVPSAPSDATEEKAVRITSTGLYTKQYDQPVVAENKLTNVDGMSAATSEIVGIKQPSKDNEGSFSDKRSLESVNAPSQLVTGEDTGSKDGLHAEVATSDSSIGWHSCMGILSSEVDSMVLSEADTRNGNNDGEGSLSHSDMPTLLAFNNKDMVENFGIPACNSVDSSALGACDASEPHTCPDPHVTQDTVFCREAAVSNREGDIQIDNGRKLRPFLAWKP